MTLIIIRFDVLRPSLAVLSLMILPTMNEDKQCKRKSSEIRQTGTEKVISSRLFQSERGREEKRRRILLFLSVEHFSFSQSNKSQWKHLLIFIRIDYIEIEQERNPFALMDNHRNRMSKDEHDSNYRSTVWKFFRRRQNPSIPLSTSSSLRTIDRPSVNRDSLMHPKRSEWKQIVFNCFLCV